MWRSLFYAVGIGVFGLGLQGLVLDQVVVPKDTKLQRLIRKVVSNDGPRNQNPGFTGPQSLATGASSQQYPVWDQRTTQPQDRQSQNSRFANFNSGSRYGPSRFSGPAYGTGYGGGRVGSTTANRSIFGGSSAQSANTQLAGYEASRSNGTFYGQQPTGALQNFVIREWMPWSLLASGAIIFLYTRALDGRRHHD